MRLLALAVLLGANFLGGAHVQGSGSSRWEPAVGELPVGALAKLGVAGALAVSPSGALYVVDEAHDRVLVRLSNGQFRVVAGDGKVGFSGDGGPAIDAELSDVPDLAFGPDGVLYMVDGSRVRAVGTDGVIRTVAGNGRPLRLVANGSPALSAALGPEVHLCFSVGGQLYISDSSQLLRSSALGRLDTINAAVRSGPMAGSFDRNLLNIAVDAQGDIDVAGFDGWEIWRVSPNGSATDLGYDRGSGGNVPDLERGPGGAVYAEDGSEIVRAAQNTLVPTYDLGVTVHDEYFWLHHFAFGRGGVIYADEIPGGEGFGRYQQLIEWEEGRVQLLWQES